MSVSSLENPLRIDRTIVEGGIVTLTRKLGAIEAAQWNELVIEQGRTFTLRALVIDEGSNPIDLSSDYTADFQIVGTRGGTALVTLSEGSGITLSGGSGGFNVLVEIAAATTAALAFKRAFYELAITKTTGSVHQPLLWGCCALRARVVVP